MRRPRPMTLMIAALALAGVARAVTSVIGYADPDAPFFGAAHAAGTPDTAAAPGPDAPPGAAPAPVVCESPESILQAMEAERGLLDQQKNRLADRESEIELASESLRVEQARLTELKSEVQGLLDRVKRAQTDDVNRLVALYSAMKPKEAAAILDDMDIEVSVMVLATMAEREAAPILARLSATRARAISRIILERSKLPGDQRLQDLKL